MSRCLKSSWSRDLNHSMETSFVPKRVLRFRALLSKPCLLKNGTSEGVTTLSIEAQRNRIRLGYLFYTRIKCSLRIRSVNNLRDVPDRATECGH